MVITKEPVYNYVPLQKNDDVITTQFTMTTIERLGLLKMDFLGLRTLTVIRDAADMAEKSYGIKLDMNSVPLDDEEVYKMISKGDSDGVFQLESTGMKRFMTELKPTNPEDIIAGFLFTVRGLWSLFRGMSLIKTIMAVSPINIQCLSLY